MTRWLEFSASDGMQLRETLLASQPALGLSRELTSSWIQGFVESLPSDEWAVSLGVAPSEEVNRAGFRPFLLYTIDNVPTPLTQICLRVDGCTTCTNAVATREQEAPKVPPGEFTGICATLSTAYSLVYSLGKETESSAMEQSGSERVWKRGFLDLIKRDQQHRPGKGTPRDQIKKAYERYGCQCGDEVSIASVGTAAAWKQQLKAQLDIPSDCHFIIDFPGANRNFAHDMHIDGIEGDALGVADTGIQGGGGGDDIPVVSRELKWEVTDSPSGPRVKLRGEGFWASINVTAASFICCSCPG